MALLAAVRGAGKRDVLVAQPEALDRAHSTKAMPGSACWPNAAGWAHRLSPQEATTVPSVHDGRDPLVPAFDDRSRVTSIATTLLLITPLQLHNRDVIHAPWPPPARCRFRPPAALTQQRRHLGALNVCTPSLHKQPADVGSELRLPLVYKVSGSP